MMEPLHCKAIFDGDNVTGIEAHEGEKLMFVEPVAFSGAADTMNRISEASKKAVRSHMEKAVAIDGDVLALLHSDCINQAVQVADLIRNTAAVEKLIQDVKDKNKEGKEAQLPLLNDYTKSIEVKLEALSLESKKDLSK